MCPECICRDGFGSGGCTQDVGACKREAVLVAAAGRSVVDALTARVKGAVGAGGPARVSLGEVSEMIDVVRLGLSAGLSFDAALEIFCANRRSVLALRLERACMAWQVGVGTREDELLAAARDLDVRALETFAITVGQALALGAPLAETLAAQSRESVRLIARGRARDRTCARQAADSHSARSSCRRCFCPYWAAARSRRDDVGRNT